MQKIMSSVLGFLLLTMLTVGLACAQSAPGPLGADDLAQRFSPYAGLGLSYDSASNRLYFQEQPVKLFITYQYNAFGQKTNELDLTWFDPDSYSNIYLEGGWGAYGLLEIRALDPVVAQAMLAGLQFRPQSPPAEAQPVSPLPNSASQPALVAETSPSIIIGQEPVTPPPPPPVLNLDAAMALDDENWDWNIAPPPGSEALLAPGLVLNGSQHIPSLGLTCADVDKGSLTPALLGWMAVADAQPGAHVLRDRLPNGNLDLYIYYNQGGRYPWKMNANVNAVNIFFYSTGGQVTTEGYQLLRCGLERDIPVLELFMNGAPLPYKLQDLAH